MVGLVPPENPDMTAYWSGTSIPAQFRSQEGAPPGRRRSAARASGAFSLSCARRLRLPSSSPSRDGWPHPAWADDWLTFGAVGMDG